MNNDGTVTIQETPGADRIVVPIDEEKEEGEEDEAEGANVSASGFFCWMFF